MGPQGAVTPGRTRRLMLKLPVGTLRRNSGERVHIAGGFGSLQRATVDVPAAGGFSHQLSLIFTPSMGGRGPEAAGQSGTVSFVRSPCLGGVSAPVAHLNHRPGRSEER
ncbi:unnamed protein product [Gadus morhua 'NCC']